MATPQPRQKRIVVCCDGTWDNSVSGTKNPTNVVRLSRGLESEDADGIAQIVYYHTGIGTTQAIFGPYIDGATGRGRIDTYHAQVLKAYTSAGIKYNIRHAYSFVCLNYCPGDEIYLVGFSRGAYTVRCILALIARVGLLKKTGLAYLDGLYKAWEMHFTNEAGGAHKLNEVLQKLEDHDLLQCDSNQKRDITIEACVVWETVAAIWTRSLDFVELTIPPNVKNVFHALALNEKREKFYPQIWVHPPAGTTLEQSWFLGAHKDVGGGNEDLGLSNITLIWMVAQLRRHTKLAISDERLSYLLNPIQVSISRCCRGFAYLLKPCHRTWVSPKARNLPLKHKRTSKMTHQTSYLVSLLSKSRRRVPKIRALHSTALRTYTDMPTFALSLKRRLTDKHLLGKISTSFKGFWKQLGEKPRTFTFVPLNGASTIMDMRLWHPSFSGTLKYQTIHSSVRSLLKDGLRQCPVLDRFDTGFIKDFRQGKQESGRVMWRRTKLLTDYYVYTTTQTLAPDQPVWRLKNKTRIPGLNEVISVWEDVASAEELHILQTCSQTGNNGKISPLAEFIRPLWQEARSPALMYSSIPRNLTDGQAPPRLEFALHDGTSVCWTTKEGNIRPTGEDTRLYIIDAELAENTPAVSGYGPRGRRGLDSIVADALGFGPKQANEWSEIGEDGFPKR